MIKNLLRHPRIDWDTTEGWLDWGWFRDADYGGYFIVGPLALSWGWVADQMKWATC